MWHVPQMRMHTYLFILRPPPRRRDLYFEFAFSWNSNLGDIFYFVVCAREAFILARARRLSAGGFCAKLLFQHQRIHAVCTRAAFMFADQGFDFELTLMCICPNDILKPQSVKLRSHINWLGTTLLWPPKLALRWNKIALNSDDLHAKSEWPSLMGFCHIWWQLILHQFKINNL